MAMDSATLYKLMILYMINKVDFPLTNSQISEFFLSNEYTNYFSLQESINELCENDFVFSETIRNTSYYYLTSEGRESLRFFENKIPNAIIDDMDTFLMTNKYKLRSEVGTISDYYRSADGDYIVHCQVNEDASTLIEINITVPTKESAASMCAKWPEASQEIYQAVVSKLSK